MNVDTVKNGMLKRADLYNKAVTAVKGLGGAKLNTANALKFLTRNRSYINSLSGFISPEVAAKGAFAGKLPILSKGLKKSKILDKLDNSIRTMHPDYRARGVVPGTYDRLVSKSLSKLLHFKLQNMRGLPAEAERAEFLDAWNNARGFFGAHPQLTLTPQRYLKLLDKITIPKMAE